GRPDALGGLLLVLPIAAIGVTLNFIIHELMHRQMARHYGAIAGFKMSLGGLFVTIVTGGLGFLLGIPGATMIYASRFSIREHGIVSIAGPLTNLAIFLGVIIVTFAMAPASGSYLAAALSFLAFISLWLAFFNLLPIPPLDGHAVFTWSKPIYIATMGITLALILLLHFVSLASLVYVLIKALVMSQFMRFTMR
ncbi:MAG: site-2 protease family protein, partial [Candidatus Micrarchaeaceae archaeon]